MKFSFSGVGQFPKICSAQVLESHMKMMYCGGVRKRGNYRWIYSVCCRMIANGDLRD